VTITNTDDDTADVLVGDPGGDTSEKGTTTKFSLALSSQPTADVTIKVKSLRTTECTVSPASVTFTTTNWGSQQDITVHGEDDPVVDGDQSCRIEIDTVPGGDATYNTVGPKEVIVINDDNDSAGV